MLSYRPHVEELRSLLERRQPLLVLQNAHPTYLGGLLQKLLANQQLSEVIQFIPGFGALALTPEGPPRPGSARGDLSLEGWMARELRERLGEARAAAPRVLWLLTSSESLQSPAVAAILAAWCQRVQREVLQDRLIIAVDGEVGGLLTPFCAVASLSLPRDESRDEQQLQGYILEILRKEQASEDITLNITLKRNLARLLQGLPAHDIFEALVEAARTSLQGAPEALEEQIKRQRSELMRLSSGLEIIVTALKPDEVGGMEELKDHLKHISCVLDDPHGAAEARVAPPRGLMLIGMPGCGKSLAAELAAALLEVPLLRLDMGGLMGGLLGQSETNLRRALAAAEAAAPCILWIDEIEKAFGGLSSGQDGGTGRRMLGSILTWMQEQHQSGVFVFATANKLDGLPPELLRRGRFDELYCVDLPDEDARAEILQIHLNKAGANIAHHEVKDFAKKLKDYTGADIEALVRDTNLQRFAAAAPVLTLAHLEGVMQHLTPLAEQFKDEIGPMRKALKVRGFKDVSRSGPHRSRLELRRGTRAPLPEALEQLRSGGVSTWYVQDGDAVRWTLRFGAVPLEGQPGRFDLSKVEVWEGKVTHPSRQGQAFSIQQEVKDNGKCLRISIRGGAVDIVAGSGSIHISHDGRILSLKREKIKEDYDQSPLAARQVKPLLQYKIDDFLLTLVHLQVDLHPPGLSFFVSQTHISTSFSDLIDRGKVKMENASIPAYSIVYSKSRANLPLSGRSMNYIAGLCNKLSLLAGLDASYFWKDDNLFWNASSNGFRLPMLSEWLVFSVANRPKKYKVKKSAWDSEVSEHFTHKPVGQGASNQFNIFNTEGQGYDIVHPDPEKTIAFHRSELILAKIISDSELKLVDLDLNVSDKIPSCAVFRIAKNQVTVR